MLRVWACIRVQFMSVVVLLGRSLMWRVIGGGAFYQFCCEGGIWLCLFWSFGSMCDVSVICTILCFRCRVGPGCVSVGGVVRVFAFGVGYVLWLIFLAFHRELDVWGVLERCRNGG